MSPNAVPRRDCRGPDIQARRIGYIFKRASLEISEELQWLAKSGFVFKHVSER